MDDASEFLSITPNYRFLQLIAMTTALALLHCNDFPILFFCFVQGRLLSVLQNVEQTPLLSRRTFKVGNGTYAFWLGI